MVGFVDQIGTGVVRTALGDDLDRRVYKLKSLNDGVDQHIDPGCGAHREYHVAEDLKDRNAVESCRFDHILRDTGDTG